SVVRASSGVREAWLERSRRSDNPYEGSTGYCALNIGVLGRVMANTVALALQLTTQSNINFIDDPASILRKYRVSTPTPDAVGALR
ncbi:MAG: hypothetical protein KC492_05975, partial [Myxococcales bacterium]|nr:hypothetical protein [Myxococcales bacterium]